MSIKESFFYAVRMLWWNFIFMYIFNTYLLKVERYFDWRGLLFSSPFYTDRLSKTSQRFLSGKLNNGRVSGVVVRFLLHSNLVIQLWENTNKTEHSKCEKRGSNAGACQKL